ncbi:uncharacterized protein OCT59_017066 [Rhizophagus irregularis]|nr:hypothetical protein OCT59_017066 [Rhizophagus irregularis]
MDANKLLQKLSQNLLEILNDDEYCDIRILSTIERRNDGTLIQIKLPNILPEIFQIILRYIYGGRLPLEEYDALDIIKILVAASELSLQELVDYIQSFLTKNKADWMEQNFNLIYQTSYEKDSFLELQKYCTNLISNNPNKIFNSLDFSTSPEKLLISIIQNDNLQMTEIQVWENVLKWGFAQNPDFPSDPSNFSKDDFNSLKNTLHQFLPKELYMDLLKTFLDSDSEPVDKLNSRKVINDNHINKKSSDEMPQYQENYGRYKKNYAQAAKILDNSSQVPKSQDKTIAEIHEDAAEQKEEADYLRRMTSSGGRGMPKMAEQMSRSGSSHQHRSNKRTIQSPDGWSTVGSSSQRNKEKVGDLTKFGSVNRSKIVSLAPGGILGGWVKGWSKSDNKDQNDKPVGLNRANSTTNIYSVLNSESSEGRRSSESNSSYTQKPSPPTERKKLILAPRTKSFTPEEPVKLASSSQTTVKLDSKKICKSIVNMVEEYFSILDSQEVITCLKEDIPVGYHPKAIETFANKVIEKKQKDVDDIMKLFKEIVSSSTCDNDAFKDGFKATLEFLMDIGADAPMAYSYTGQLLFSTELSFRDITELLKPLDDDMAIDKIVKGYAKALKNDVDEQEYVQKINEFDLTSLFPKKNKDDINKYIEDLVR